MSDVTSIRDARSWSMVTSNVALVPADLPQEKHEIADQGPMSQQGATDSHGHDMHPQKFVRLVGCHESHPVSHVSAHRLHRFPAPRGPRAAQFGYSVVFSPQLPILKFVHDSLDI